MGTKHRRRTECFVTCTVLQPRHSEHPILRRKLKKQQLNKKGNASREGGGAELDTKQIDKLAKNRVKMFCDHSRPSGHHAELPLISFVVRARLRGVMEASRRQQIKRR